MKILTRVNQRASVAAGQDAPHSTYIYDIQPDQLPEDLRKWVADCWKPSTGEISATVHRDGSTYSETPEITLPATWDELIRALTYLREGNANIEAVREKKRLEKISQIADALREQKTELCHSYVCSPGRASNVGYDYQGFPFADTTDEAEAAIAQVPGAKEWLADLERGKAKARADAEAESQRRVAACEKEDAEKAAAEQAVATFKRDWITQHGSDNQRGRLAAGMLSDDEIIATITDATFATVTVEPYQRLTKTDVDCECEYGEGCKVEFSSNDEDEATAEQWEAMESLRKLLPSGSTVKLRWHQAEREDCKQIVTRHSLRASMPVGPLIVTRHFACPDNHNTQPI